MRPSTSSWSSVLAVAAAALAALSPAAVRASSAEPVEPAPLATAGQDAAEPVPAPVREPTPAPAGSPSAMVQPASASAGAESIEAPPAVAAPASAPAEAADLPLPPPPAPATAPDAAAPAVATVPAAPVPAVATVPATPVPAAFAVPLSQALFAALPPLGPDASSGERPGQVLWYRPNELDRMLPWNESIFGVFDPWTSRKVAFLFQRRDLELEFREDPSDDDESTGPSTEVLLPELRFAGTFQGPRLELGNWGFSYSRGTANLEWSGTLLPPVALDATVYQVNWSPVAVPIVDIGAADIRIGLVLFELDLHVVTGSHRGTEPQTVDWLSITQGWSLLGLRTTIGDALYLEARIGDVYVTGTKVDVRSSAFAEKHEGLQIGYGYALRPSFRIGLAL